MMQCPSYWPDGTTWVPIRDLEILEILEDQDVRAGWMTKKSKAGERVKVGRRPARAARRAVDDQSRSRRTTDQAWCWRGREANR